MATSAPDAILGELARASRDGLDRHELARDATRVLRAAVPFDGAAVIWFDPASALPVDEWVENAPVDETDVTEFRQLAASGRRAARMSRRSGNELRAVCVGESGMWGAIAMHREPGAPSFTASDVNLLASLSAQWEEVMRVRLERDLSTNADRREPGMLLLDDEDRIEMVDAAAAAWLEELPSNGRVLPLVVTAVAHQARAIASGHDDVAATARSRTTTGRWIVVRGSVLRNGAHSRTAVTLEPARARELAGLVADASRLTARERHVTELVAQGLPSAAIAAKLHLSTYTVQDHLKAVFEKLDVSTRGELVARVFVDRCQLS
jgi:DNA-binding CsgD family transcriptional regulator